jgi:hypothetical protein
MVKFFNVFVMPALRLDLFRRRKLHSSGTQPFFRGIAIDAWMRAAMSSRAARAASS